MVHFRRLLIPVLICSIAGIAPSQESDPKEGATLTQKAINKIPATPPKSGPAQLQSALQSPSSPSPVKNTSLASPREISEAQVIRSPKEFPSQKVGEYPRAQSRKSTTQTRSLRTRKGKQGAGTWNDPNSNKYKHASNNRVSSSSAKATAATASPSSSSSGQIQAQSNSTAKPGSVKTPTKEKELPGKKGEKR
ncbi:MAG: hypothetical protein QF752_07505 [Planctomycetota bacterium]|jgi:hypothetical protein|nr:hypothetical protein [Planctomycetota bacterium]